MRSLRIEFAGALYHLTSRGNAEGAIYLDNEDRQVFLALLGSVVTRFRWQLYAYCLMGNHYHLLVETPQANLSRGMRQLNGVYTQRFNHRHARTGHVFRSRFKGILVERDNYLIEIARYIVLNPIRTKVASDLAEYAWSSYQATAGLRPPPPWLNADFILSRFGLSKSAARHRYVSFVQSGMDLPKVWDNLKQQIYLGSETFVEDIQKHVMHLANLEEVPRVQKHPPRKPLDTYANTYANAAAAMLAAYRSGHYSLAAIGKHFGVHYSTVSRAVRMAEQNSQLSNPK